MIRSIEDYEGYGGDEESQFGVIDHTELYLSDDRWPMTLQLLKVDGDRFGDGATNGTFADSVRIRIR